MSFLILYHIHDYILGASSANTVSMSQRIDKSDAQERLKKARKHERSVLGDMNLGYLQVH